MKTSGTAGGSCPHCGREFETAEYLLPGYGRMRVPLPCTCERAMEEAAAEAERQVREERREKFLKVWTKAGIPEEFIGVASDFSAVDTLDAGRSVYLTGKNGRGKTYRACQYAKGYLVRHTKEYKGVMRCWKSAHFYTSQEVLSMIRTSWDRWDMTEEDVFSHLIGVDLLILDDMGKEVPSEWSATSLFRLVDERWKRHKPMIITSQYSTSDVGDRMCKTDAATIGALRSRLRGWCEGEVLEGPDRRLR